MLPSGLDPTALASLPGGTGRTWRCCDVVLKPVEFVPEHVWQVAVLDAWPSNAPVRVPVPLRTTDGGLHHDGWWAQTLLAGANAPAGSDVVRDASIAFHACIKALPRPEFLDTRDDPWTYGDRVAWEGKPLVGAPRTRELLSDLVAAFRPVTASSQVVHGDIGGNVLAHPDLPPAVIDWPPYYRPPGWALAVAALDAVAWHDARRGLLEEWGRDQPEWNQMLLRALTYRIATLGVHEEHGRGVGFDHAAVHRPLVDLLVQRQRPEPTDPPRDSSELRRGVAR